MIHFCKRMLIYNRKQYKFNVEPPAVNVCNNLITEICFGTRVILIQQTRHFISFLYVYRKICMGTPNFFLLFIEVNNKRTFVLKFTEVVSCLVGQILNTVKIYLKSGFTGHLNHFIQHNGTQLGLWIGLNDIGVNHRTHSS